jgi:uncharacterized protein (TIGR02118 family)
MARLLVMYKTPRDAAAFDKHYADKHVALAKKIPGLRKFETSKGPVATPAGPSGYHLVAILQFDDVAAIQKGFASAEGQAAVPTRRRWRPAASISSCSTAMRLSARRN